MVGTQHKKTIHVYSIACADGVAVNVMHEIPIQHEYHHIAMEHHSMVQVI